MHQVFLGIGGNIGNKSENFRKVRSDIKKNVGKILSASSIYETPPWGFQSKENFWNMVFLVVTELAPLELLYKIHKIEKNFGRKRSGNGYEDREIDIDILYFDDKIIESENLIVPHPKLQFRKFVLIPLVEIAPNYNHPVFHQTNLVLLENCKDESVIKRID